jgi:hypothetical protein
MPFKSRYSWISGTGHGPISSQFTGVHQTSLEALVPVQQSRRQAEADTSMTQAWHGACLSLMFEAAEKAVAPSYQAIILAS